MAVIHPIAKENAAAELAETYAKLGKSGRVANFFAVMAHRPAVLKNFLPLYASIVNEGVLEPRYKELAYLKASTLNTCEY